MSIMESMGKKKPRPRRSFTPEFKAEIVELCRRGDRSVGTRNATGPATAAASGENPDALAQGG
jgi:transposase-like protein